ncbi:MAG: peptide chain release factor N(5)-glutamine methyltransferase, partial [Natronospirillum sp.]
IVDRTPGGFTGRNEPAMSASMVPEELKQAIQWAVAVLQDSDRSAAGADPNADARLDSQLLLSHILAKPRSFLFTWPDHTLSAQERANFESMVRRRAAGEPVAYLIGHCAFWTLNLLTDHSTLIPRPDTETLVQAVLERLPSISLDVVDLGTGTGAIALALASERPLWRMMGLDCFDEVVQLARRNGARNNLPQVRFLRSDWCAVLADHSVDALVSNPPYIRPDDPHLEQGDVRYEPRSSLAADEQGLADFRTIVKQSGRVLRAGGWLFFEHGFEQAEDVALLLIDAGFAQVDTLRDMGGRPRVTLGQWPQRII